MSNYIDLKFINQLSLRLEQFKKRTEYLFNFRCPHCGDSKKSKTKSRGYFYRVKNDMFFKCHNCGMGQNLANFIKFVDPKLYETYLLERYKGSAPATPKPLFDFKPPKFETKILDGLKSIEELADTHPARKYISMRLIPPEYYGRLYYCSKFYSLVKKVKPDTFDERYEHPRLIIPFFDVSGNLFAFQGRAFGKEQPKYVTIKLDENKQKIFGLERLNYQQHIYIVEGPLDSLFIDNCIAAAGSDLTLRVKPEETTYIFDNEPRNKEIIDRMYKVIEKNYNIVIWPEEVKCKDINEMIQSGLDRVKVKQMIDSNTFSKLEALTRLNTFKKC